MIQKAIKGEDVPITASYEDSGDDGIDADTEPTITIEADDGTTVVNSISMTSLAGTGEYEYVWDTDTDATTSGEYTIEVNGEFSSLTRIERATIEIAPSSDTVLVVEPGETYVVSGTESYTRIENGGEVIVSPTDETIV